MDISDVEEGFADDLTEAFEEVELLCCDDLGDALDDGFVVDGIADVVGESALEIVGEIEDDGDFILRSGGMFFVVDAVVAEEADIFNDELCMHEDPLLIVSAVWRAVSVEVIVFFGRSV